MTQRLLEGSFATLTKARPARGVVTAPAYRFKPVVTLRDSAPGEVGKASGVSPLAVALLTAASKPERSGSHEDPSICPTREKGAIGFFRPVATSKTTNSPSSPVF